MERVSSVNAFGVKYKVKCVENIPVKDTEYEEGFLWGLCDYIKRVIYISLKDNEGKAIEESHIERTFLHEVLHAILQEGGYDEAVNDEVLICYLSGNLQQVIGKVFK